MWTPLGRGAVATIKVCGDLAALFLRANCPVPFRAANGKPLAAQQIGRIVFGHWGTDPSEEVVICRPSDNELEIHCHGGLAAARRIMSDWGALQFEVVDWTVQSQHAQGQLAADCQAGLARATTLRTAAILLDQESAWREFLTGVECHAVRRSWSELRAEVQSALGWWDLGRHLLEPFRVVLTGPPNVGKSALLNALVGYQRSVVFDQPGTTRDVVTAETAFSGWPVRLIDTAGLRDNATGLEAAGIELARGQLSEADLVLQVQDVTRAHDNKSTTAFDSEVRTIHVANKLDLLADSSAAMAKSPGAIGVSARLGTGIEQLIAAIAERLVPEAPPQGTLVPFLEHQHRWLETLLTRIEQRSASAVLEHVRDMN